MSHLKYCDSIERSLSYSKVSLFWNQESAIIKVTSTDMYNKSYSEVVDQEVIYAARYFHMKPFPELSILGSLLYSQ